MPSFSNRPSSSPYLTIVTCHGGISPGPCTLHFPRAFHPGKAQPHSLALTWQGSKARPLASLFFPGGLSLLSHPIPPPSNSPARLIFIHSNGSLYFTYILTLSIFSHIYKQLESFYELSAYILCSFANELLLLLTIHTAPLYVMEMNLFFAIYNEYYFSACPFPFLLGASFVLLCFCFVVKRLMFLCN